MSFENDIKTLEDKFFLQPFSALGFEIRGKSIVLTNCDIAALNGLTIKGNRIGDLIAGNPEKAISGLTYYETHGYHLKGISEFFIGLSYGQEPSPNAPLKFKIGGITVEMGPASKISEFFILSKYTTRYIETDFPIRFHSIKIFSADPKICNSYYHKAMYYLNSHYLHASKNFAFPIHFEDKDDDYYPLKEGELHRSRIRNRKDFKFIEPLILFNYAKGQEGEVQFLYYYRSIEFFFPHVLEKKVGEMTNIAATKPSDLISLIRETGRNEEKTLKLLLELALTPAKKKAIINYCRGFQWFQGATIGALASFIYSKRNHVVHAKADQIHDAFIPQVEWSEITGNRYLNYVLRDIARNVITYFNAKS